MSRLIDADALMRKAQRVAVEAWKMKMTASIETTLNQFIDWIKSSPTIDVVEVVRCKECKHWQKDIDESGIIERINFSKCIKGHYGDGMDFFCSHGERRES